MTVDIQSPANRRIVETARLKKRRDRTARSRFLVEGTREVARAFEAGASLHEVFVCPDLAPEQTAELARHIAGSGVAMTTVSAMAFEKLSMRQNPDGIVAVAATWEPGLDALDGSLVLVAESIEKPGNLGAMFRTADATGATLVVAGPTVDVFNPNVIRASQGALFSVPFAVADADAVVRWVQAHGRVYVTMPGASVDLWHTDLTGPVSIVIGSEHAGVSDAWDGVGTPIGIPMAGAADSLNASVSAAVVLYEAVRQRT